MMIENITIFLTAIFCLPFIFYIPGYLINSIFFPDRILKFDSLLILDILVSVILSSFTGLILAQVGFFSLLNLMSLLVLVSIFLYLRFKKTGQKLKFDLKIPLNSENVIVILLIFFSVILFFQPFPWILGNTDPGVYISNGIHIAKSGSLLVKDPLLSEMNTSIQEILYDVEPANVYGIISWANTNFKFQFPGFFITDIDSGTITPQFLHIYPIWIAIFYSIFGISGIFFVNPIFGVLSVLSLYLIGKRLFSWKVGALAGFLLILNFGQVWYTRYPFAEIMTQFFILSGLATFIHFNKLSDKYLGVISALLFALAALTKFEAIFLSIPFLLYYIYIFFNKKWTKIHYYFLSTICIISIYILIDYILFAKPYVNFVWQFLLNSPPEVLSPYKYNLFYNLNMIVWCVSGLGAFLVLVGMAIILINKNKNEKLLLLLIVLFFSYQTLSKLGVAEPPPWPIRRFIPVLFPLYALFTSFALNEISKIRKGGFFLFFVLTVFIIILLGSASYPILNHSEGYGLKEGISKLSEQFGDDDIIIMGSSVQSAELSTPLYYIYNKKIILLYRFDFLPNLGERKLPPPNIISLGIDYLLDNASNVYIVHEPGNVYMEKLLFYLASTHKIEYIDTQEFSYRHIVSTLDNLPKNKIDIHIKSNIFKISRPEPSKNVTLSIDIGTPQDILYLEDGFFGQEKWPETYRKNAETFRWTSDNASIRIPTPQNEDILIQITAGGLRPENAPHANVSIYLNNILIGNLTTQGEYEMHNMIVNKDYISNPYSTLRIISSTWKPSEYLRNNDTRELGVNIDKIFINNLEFSI